MNKDKGKKAARWIIENLKKGNKKKLVEWGESKTKEEPKEKPYTRSDAINRVQETFDAEIVEKKPGEPF